MGNGRGLAQTGAVSRRRGILRPQGRALTRLKGSARSDQVVATSLQDRGVVKVART
ncbi:hypothetical protein BSU04_27805 [Caballeronia sordidicola]|uniref:Uncharacterized protein n=1 Tax=Caballeronia sordidicola TaxID=196367 RepID=A0A226WVQ1_CABSO|nr:hypothetical protein BSU04_27805 [Caballeronia sordidicola]